MKVSDRIRLALEADIRNGVLLPGDAIDEQALAARHQVSRTPVREALLQLKVQGIVDSQRAAARWWRAWTCRNCWRSGS